MSFIKAPTYLLEENGINYLYHITHKKNLESILEYGLLSRNLVLKQRIKVFEIGNLKIIRKREQIKLSKSNLNLNDYVPLYFNPRNAMMYNVCKKFNANRLVVLAFDLKVILIKGTIFTDGNAASNGTNFYHSKYELEKFDWAIINSKKWASDCFVYPEKKRKMMSETLVKDKIPPEYLKKIFCNCVESAKEVEDLVEGKIEVEVSEDMFFYE